MGAWEEFLIEKERKESESFKNGIGFWKWWWNSSYLLLGIIGLIPGALISYSIYKEKKNHYLSK